MKPMQFSYAIVQYSAHPERYEYVNVGVLVFDHSSGKTLHRLASDLSRVKREFSDANISFLKLALGDFVDRVSQRFGRGLREEDVSQLNASQPGMLSVTPFRPLLSLRPQEALERLFKELVDVRPSRAKSERVGTRLANCLRSAGVLGLLDKRPKEVSIEKYGVSIRAHYGYQNGRYNLIDAARFDEPEKALAEAGKRVLEGKALAETLGHRLVVVGDFGEQPASFVEAIRQDLALADSRLFKMEEVGMLADEIRRTAH